MAVLTVNKDSDQGKGIRLNSKRNCYIWKKKFTYTYRSSTITPKREWKTARQNCINGSILQMPLCYTLKVQNNFMEFFLFMTSYYIHVQGLNIHVVLMQKTQLHIIVHIRKYNNVLFCLFTYLFSTLTFTQL